MKSNVKLGEGGVAIFSIYFTSNKKLRKFQLNWKCLKAHDEGDKKPTLRLKANRNKIVSLSRIAFTGGEREREGKKNL